MRFARSTLQTAAFARACVCVCVCLSLHTLDGVPRVNMRVSPTASLFFLFTDSSERSFVPGCVGAARTCGTCLAVITLVLWGFGVECWWEACDGLSGVTRGQGSTGSPPCPARALTLTDYGELCERHGKLGGLPAVVTVALKNMISATCNTLQIFFFFPQKLLISRDWVLNLSVFSIRTKM